MARGDALLEAILDAILAGGVVLAASCGGEGPRSAPTDASPADAVMWPAVPPGVLGCKDQGGVDSSSCCFNLYCLEPASVGGSCPPGERLSSQTISGAPGSGFCWCGPVGGPYQGEVGKCCYTAGIVGCLGRPLLVAGQRRQAAVVPGDDWAA